jgi:hypothetical protein
MNKLIDALQTNDTFNKKGALAHSTTGSAIIDLFSIVGAVRTDPQKAVDLFYPAFLEDPLTAVRIAFYVRDPRSPGLGERAVGRALMRTIAINYPQIMKYNIGNVPAFGRWDDLYIFQNTAVEKEAMDLMVRNILSNDRLASKWAKREKQDKQLAKLTRFYLEEAIGREVTAKEYRQLIASNSDTVEQLMCANRWDEIAEIFDSIPSQAMKVYHAAFARRFPQEFEVEYLGAVERGEKEIKTGTLMPYQIVKQVGDKGSSSRAQEALWNNLPDYVSSSVVSPLAVVDTSGSMGDFGYYSSFGGGLDSSGLKPIHIALSLGLYLAERALGPFKDHFITFSNHPQLQTVVGRDLHEKLRNMNNANWDMNTNLRAVFELILDRAVRFNVPQEDMPNTILIMSDMQFDRAGDGMNDADWIAERYVNAGYNVPRIVWWHINAAHEGKVTYPQKASAIQTALVSGASATTFQLVLGEELSPMYVVDKAVNSGHYDSIQLPPGYASR